MSIMPKLPRDSVVVFDFETTGLSPNNGDRPIEIGAVRITDGKLVERFSQLMNPSIPIPRFVETLTGITNRMVVDAPPCGEVMNEFFDFVGDSPMVAHNASFDAAFLRAEAKRCRRSIAPELCCTLLLSRRLLADAPSHSLSNLAATLNLPVSGDYHRALADAEVTAHLWLHLLELLQAQMPRAQINFSLLQKITTTARHKLPALYALH